MSSLGKNFEKLFKEQARTLPNVYVYRLVDQVSYLKGSWNPCDFFCYKKPTFYFVELKTCATASLPRKNIADTQLNSMYEAISIKGIKAFVVVWFYSKGVCRAFPIKYLWKLFNKDKKKSVRYDDEHGILIRGDKLKKYFIWHWEELFK